MDRGLARQPGIALRNPRPGADRQLHGLPPCPVGQARPAVRMGQSAACGGPLAGAGDEPEVQDLPCRCRRPADRDGAARLPRVYGRCGSGTRPEGPDRRQPRHPQPRYHGRSLAQTRAQAGCRQGPPARNNGGGLFAPMRLRWTRTRCGSHVRIGYDSHRGGGNCRRSRPGPHPRIRVSILCVFRCRNLGGHAHRFRGTGARGTAALLRVRP